MTEVAASFRPPGRRIGGLWRAGWTVWTHPSLRTGVFLLLALILFSVIGSAVLGDPTQQDLLNTYAEPGAPGHPLGTDPLGRDILAWIAGGIQIALIVSLSVVGLSAAIGVVVGIVAGYFGGVVESILMRLVDLQLAVPPILVFIAASAVISPGLASLILLLAVFGWVPYARIVRSTIVSERERGYVAAARLAGAGKLRILFVHLLPATTTLTLVLASLQIGYVLLVESSLSFLGLGITPPRTSLGFIIAQGRAELVDAWWVVTFPGIAIVLLVLATNLIGDGLRDVFHLDVDVLGRRR